MFTRRPSDGRVSTICVQDIDVQYALQFKLRFSSKNELSHPPFKVDISQGRDSFQRTIRKASWKKEKKSEDMLRVAALEVWRLFTLSEKKLPQAPAVKQVLGTANMPAKWTNRQELLARRKEATSDRFKEDGAVAKFPPELEKG